MRGSRKATRPVRVPGEWRPRAVHEKALALVMADPSLAGRRVELAEALGMSRAAVFAWWTGRTGLEFTRWWNASLLELSREQIGPCVQELQRLVFDPDVPASAKAKLVDTMIKALPVATTKDVGTAVAAILERWNPHYGQARIVATRDGIAAEIDSTTVAERGMSATDPVRPDHPPDAMTLPPSIDAPVRTLREIADAALAEARRTPVRVVTTAAPDPATTERRYTTAARPGPVLAGAGDGGPKSHSPDRSVNEPLPSSAPQPPDLRLYPHVFRGGRCGRCGVSERTTSKWCKGPTVCGDNARGPDALRRNLPEGVRGVDRILRRMRERGDHEGEGERQ